MSYGLGTENAEPAGLRRDARQPRVGRQRPAQLGGRLHARGLPGHRIQATTNRSRTCNRRTGFDAEQQRASSICSTSSIGEHAGPHPEQTELDARINSYELAFRMQAEAPEAVDLAQETAETQRLYGIDEKETADVGRLCLLARRLVERGVRFVQLYHGAGSKWDAHASIEKNHASSAVRRTSRSPGCCRI